MRLKNFKRSLEKLDAAIMRAEKEGIDLNAKGNVSDFRKQKEEQRRTELRAALKDTLMFRWSPEEYEDESDSTINEIREICEKLGAAIEKNRMEEAKSLIKSAGEKARLLRELKNAGIEIKLRPIPQEISEDIHSDFNEIKVCYDAGAYRSVTILCGRILETALHRKYFELTQNDLLETAPGLGLGKMVAKLSELNVELGPGISEQIHLINKVRVSSVHKKAAIVYPSKEQAHAMALYTVDVLNRLF